MLHLIFKSDRYLKKKIILRRMRSNCTRIFGRGDSVTFWGQMQMHLGTVWIELILSL